jgi:hypothetical protein
MKVVAHAAIETFPRVKAYQRQEMPDNESVAMTTGERASAGFAVHLRTGLRTGDAS